MISLSDRGFEWSAYIRCIRMAGQPAGRPVESIVYSVLRSVGYTVQARAGTVVACTSVSVFMQILGFCENRGFS